MDDQQPHEITRLLNQWSEGDIPALEELVPLVYADLRRIALHHLANERPDHTLQPTALINEVFVRLLGQHSLEFENRRYFFGAAANLMRRILVDYARRRGADKRGGAPDLVNALMASRAHDGPRFEILALDRALDRLAGMDPELANLVELRFFGGLEVEEVSRLLGVSTATVKREWASARAWLWHELSRS